jgi:ABC-type Fe3+/spermidine/putrescine transport system ATPase subunit
LTAIRIDGVARAFGPVQAVRGVTLDIREGELFTLLGPSGCGKTTLLRMVAGFCDIDRGSISFGGKRVDTLPPHRRNTGMVFQNYAIFPNLTVAGNVAYGLKARRLPRDEIATRAARALKLVQLGGYEERWPHQLSGGQLQRVAIARCLVIEPEVLLLDEPLSNLDAQLRVETRAEIRRLQQSLRITALYVTHDQEEALAISDRIAVMRAGQVEQVGTPTEIYRRPATPFVAEFVGTTNLLSGTMRGTEVAVGGDLFRAPNGNGGTVSFSLRPEALRVLRADEPAPEGWPVLRGRVGFVEFLGALTRAEVILPGGTTLRMATVGAPVGDDMVAVTYDPADITVFEE